MYTSAQRLCNELHIGYYFTLGQLALFCTRIYVVFLGLLVLLSIWDQRF